MPDPRPLEEHLGRVFFDQAPREPGVYLMRDAAARVLYVGKAKNLRQRLQHYRIANPDRMPRRHLRLLREVAQIEFEVCPGEAAALQRESWLLRALKPKYNRAGVWPGRTRFLVWRLVKERLELAVHEAPAAGWERSGPLGAGALHLHRTLAGLLWLAMNPGRAVADLPAGWNRRKVAEVVSIHCGEAAAEAGLALAAFLGQSPERFAPWLESCLTARAHPFERAVIAAGLETIKEFSASRQRRVKNQPQPALP